MNIIKIGGGKSINIRGIISDLGNYDEQFIIVHGANSLRDELAVKLNYKKSVITSVKGYSSVYTDDEAMNIMMMSYAGLRNKRIVELCQQYGINAIGLTGIDGRIIRGNRNKGIRVREAGKLKIVRDNSGKPDSINTDLLNLLINNGYVPVLTVPIIDENFRAINSENDDIITVLNNSINAKRVFQFIEAPGYLSDSSNESSVINSLSKLELQSLEEKADGRMKRKIHALNKLISNTNTQVIIADGRVENPLREALNGNGTIING